jgi:hypothetical protein
MFWAWCLPIVPTPTTPTPNFAIAVLYSLVRPSFTSDFVEGLGFSRADQACRKTRALAPEEKCSHDLISICENQI